ncbi:MAG: hypothetical protein L3K19_02465 [Thermoplasmata archaeon]|nr:hypothetical protein [Thermoplasmata archaeon]
MSPPVLRSAPAGPPPPSATVLRDSLLQNFSGPRSDAGPRPHSGAVPNSARIETPPPPTPNTVPTVQTFLSYSLGCCVQENFTVPTGTWETVVLNYTGLAVGGVYDTSYRAYLDGTLVLYGTTPEYGTWTVLQNLSEYSRLLHGVANLTFLLGGTTIGAFRTNLTLSYYPVPTGASPPPAPDEIIPLWLFESVTSSGQMIYANATVPSNVSSAVLQLYAFPYQSDEFFWDGSSGPNPTGLRIVEFGLNSTPLGSIIPFPFIQTGSVDFYLWRPISGAFTLNMPAYQLNLTGALGDIEGNHRFWADLQGVGVGAKWEVEASLLLWTNASIVSARPLSHSFTGPSTTTSGGVQRAQLTFESTSEIVGQTRSWNASSATTITFSDALAPVGSGNWQNVTESTVFSETTSIETPKGNASEVRTYGFPLSVDLGAKFVETSSTGGGYPILGNFTTYMLNTHQQWDASVTSFGPSPVGPVITDQRLTDDQLADASGYFGGEEQFATPTSNPTILAYNSSGSSTTKEYTETTGPPTDARIYSHLLAGSTLQPAPPYFAETVTADVTQSTPFPLQGTVIATPSAMDLGAGTVLSATATGGIAPYRYLWSGLPPGCLGAGNSSSVHCTPTTAGSFQVVLRVRDSSGALGPDSAVVLLVAEPLSARLISPTGVIDQGGNATMYPLVTGGVPPLACQWAVNRVQSAGNCSTPFVASGPVVGTLLVQLTVADATGATATSRPANITVAPGLTVAVFLTAAGVSVHAGTPVSVSAVTTGGAGAVSFNWTLNGTLLNGAGGSNLTFVPAGAGTYQFAVLATDASGNQVLSNAVDLNVTSPASPRIGPAVSSTSGFPEWAGYAAIAAALAELAVLAWVIVRRPPRQPAPRPTPPVPRGPPPAGPPRGAR